jgi:microcompartment protein CcmK/EutM
MDLARVIGTVVASHKDASLTGVQLCVIEPVDGNRKAVADPLIASEADQSRSVGDIVYYVASGDAVFTHPDGRVMPVDAAIVGLVDNICLG